jgi:hypothetical protein
MSTFQLDYDTRYPVRIFHMDKPIENTRMNLDEFTEEFLDKTLGGSYVVYDGPKGSYLYMLATSSDKSHPDQTSKSNSDNKSSTSETKTNPDTLVTTEGKVIAQNVEATKMWQAYGNKDTLYGPVVQTIEKLAGPFQMLQMFKAVQNKQTPRCTEPKPAFSQHRITYPGKITGRVRPPIYV